MSEIVLPWGAWDGDGQLELELPSTWEIKYVAPTALSPCSESNLTVALSNPIASPTLRSMVASTARVAIVVEDITRPAPLETVLRVCLRQLEEAGVRKNNLLVLVALGAHGRMSDREIRQKLGSEVSDNLRVVQHEFRDVTDSGRDLYGRRVFLNRHLLECDMAVLVGSLLPHPFAGFSGGAKLIFPGLSDLETVRQSHLSALMGIGRPRYGEREGNHFRIEIENLVKGLCPLFSICVVCTQTREIAAAFAGDVVEAHRAGCEYYKRIFTTPISGDPEVLLLNAFPKDMDLVQSEIVLSFYKAFRERHGAAVKQTVVVTAACPKGAGDHELLGARGSLRRNQARTRHLDGSDLLIFAPAVPDDDGGKFFLSSALRFREWSVLCAELVRRHGQHGRINVVPFTPMQIPT